MNDDNQRYGEPPTIGEAVMAVSILLVGVAAFYLGGIWAATH